MGRKPPMIAELNADVMLLVAAPARNVGAGGSAARSVVLSEHASTAEARIMVYSPLA